MDAADTYLVLEGGTAVVTTTLRVPLAGGGSRVVSAVSYGGWAATASPNTYDPAWSVTWTGDGRKISDGLIGVLNKQEAMAVAGALHACEIDPGDVDDDIGLVIEAIAAETLAVLRR